MDRQEIDRLAVFTSRLDFTVSKGILEILEAFEDMQIHVLLLNPSRVSGRVIRNQFRNLRKHGPAWIPYQAADVLSRLVKHPEPTAALGIARPGARYGLDALLGSGRVTLSRLDSFATDEAPRLLREFAPDLGLSLGAPILKPAVFKVPRLGTINLHKGKLPDYRGMPPAFWEIRDKQESVGCTVHVMEAKLDSGDIILEDKVAIEAFSTPAGLRVELDRLGNALVVQAIRQLSEGTAEPRQQAGAGRTNSRPTLGLERQLQKEIAVRQGTTGPKRQAKDFVFNGYSLLRGATRRFEPARRKSMLAALLYHRVSDAFRDHVTIGIEQFDEQMAYLKRHWQVVPLRALVRGEVDWRSPAPMVCITFDDGYEDNYLHAAPILLKHRLPATFFVSTNKLTNQIPFEHDLDKLGHGLPNMSWDAVREMQRDGLDFGSHTANHINLARASSADAWTEIVESKETLRRELGQEEFLFAYPFGGRHDVTPAALEQVREAGYVCCCSAYGGVNRGQLDLFNILRMGVNYNFSLPALRARLHGWG